MRGGKILIIEDNVGNLELMSYLLSAFGHVPVVATTSERGIEAARTGAPDLIVCDIHLPGLDGYAVARALKDDATLKSVPLIAVTAMAMAGDSDKGLAAGFDGYISKPIDPPNFVASIERWLRPELHGCGPTPFSAADTANAVSEPSDTPLHFRARILVVDDSPVNRELVRDILTPCGYDVQLANSVDAALAIARKQPPDLILSDLHMPSNDGFALLRQIREDSALLRVPFVFISSSAWGEQDHAQAARYGVTRFLLRPIEPRALQAHVAGCLHLTGAA
ncbi:MAG: response regulator [Tahibacter sp.]